MIVSIIAAFAAQSRVIGRNGGLPWRLPDDLARFRELTMGHTLLMGRRTFQSLGGRRLSGRRIIVLSRSLPSIPASADSLAASFEEGLRTARHSFGENELFIAGGERVYRQALEQGAVDRMYLTIVEAQIEGDAFFPEYDPSDWKETQDTSHPADDDHPHAFHFKTLERAD